MAKKKEVKEKTSKKDVSDGIACAILTYLLIGIIWYFADEKMKKNAYAKFHVKQGLVLLIASIIFLIAWSIIFSVLAAIFILLGPAGWVIITILGLVFWIPLVWCIMGIVYAATGKKKELPVIGHFARKFAF